jgi:hypothetical protein
MSRASEKEKVTVVLYTAAVTPATVEIVQLAPVSVTEEYPAPEASVRLAEFHVSIERSMLFVYRRRTRLVGAVLFTTYARSLRSPSSGTTNGIFHLSFLFYVD